MSRRLTVVAVLIAVVTGMGGGLGASGIVRAATPSGITVSPVSITMELPKAAESKEGTVTVRNDYTEAVSFTASIRGMRMLANGALAPTDTPEAAIGAALTVTPMSFALEPGQSINLRLRLNNSTELSPGGHYASVLIKQSGAAGRGLSLSPAVSVAVFAIKEDVAVRATRVTSLQTDGWLLKPPTTATISFAGAGNVSVVPRAVVSMYDPRDRMVMTGVVNDESIPVRPGSSIKLQSVLRSVGFVWAPGKYTMHVQYRHDGADIQESFAVSRWLVPPAFLYGLGAVIVLVVGSARFVVRTQPWHRLQRRKRRQETLAAAANAERRAGKAIDVIVKKRSVKAKGVER